MNELWMRSHSVARWMDASLWDGYFRRVEKVIGDQIVKIDTTDPVRRKANVAKGEGAFVVQFKAREDSRWVFGSFDKTGISFQIRYFKVLGAWENTVLFVVPESSVPVVGIERLNSLFDLNNGELRAFYGYADMKSVICAKKPCTPSLDISRELLGVFWLTYFGNGYVDHLGRQKLLSITGAAPGPVEGITIRLAEDPASVREFARVEAEDGLGGNPFAGHGDAKSRGQYALTLTQLASVGKQ